MGLKPTTLVLLESSMTCSSHRECGSVTEFIWSRSFSINAPQCSLFHSSYMYGEKGISYQSQEFSRSPKKGKNEKERKENKTAVTNERLQEFKRLVTRLCVSRQIGKIGKKFDKRTKSWERFSAIVTVQPGRTESCQPEQILNFQFNKNQFYNSKSRRQDQFIYLEKIMKNSRIPAYLEDLLNKWW